MATATLAVSPVLITDNDIVEQAGFLRLVGDPTRLRIMYILREAGEMHVGALCEKLGQTQPAVSHHLALGRASGILTTDRRGKQNFYSIDQDCPHIGVLEAIFVEAGFAPKRRAGK